MTNRREFLHLGVAALSVPIAAKAGMSSEIFATDDGTDAKSLPLYKIFYDERFAACGAFAEELNRRELATHVIRGDITDVWFNDLYYRWRQAPTAIAGMTAPGPIFCLEMLAREAGMRVALRVDHRWYAPGRMIDGRMEHEFSGPEDLYRRAAELETSGALWPGRMAEMVAKFPAERGRATAARFSSRADTNRENPEHLVTWVIVPAREERTPWAPSTRTRRA